MLMVDSLGDEMEFYKSLMKKFNSRYGSRGTERAKIQWRMIAHQDTYSAKKSS